MMMQQPLKLSLFLHLRLLLSEPLPVAAAVIAVVPFDVLLICVAEKLDLSPQNIP